MSVRELQGEANAHKKTEMASELCTRSDSPVSSLRVRSAPSKVVESLKHGRLSAFAHAGVCETPHRHVY